VVWQNTTFQVFAGYLGRVSFGTSTASELGHGGFVKSISTLLLAFTLGLALSTALLAVQAPAGPKDEQGSKKKAAPASSLSGCVDQQDGRYVLVDDRDLNPVADLEADGFPTEGFAKHMGQKVTVRGTSSSGSTRPLFKVRSIETVSETCAPTQKPQKK
jgi:hypothetical protein